MSKLQTWAEAHGSTLKRALRRLLDVTGDFGDGVFESAFDFIEGI
jgi:hypothetical protein